MPRTVVVAVFCALAVSCGGQAASLGGESIRITSAQWSAEPEPTAVVKGEWSLATSTPPSCSLLEGKNGEPSEWYDRSAAISLDSGQFSRQFARGDSAPALKPDVNYHVRCRVSQSTGKTVEAIAPVRGEIPLS